MDVFLYYFKTSIVAASQWPTCLGSSWEASWNLEEKRELGGARENGTKTTSLLKVQFYYSRHWIMKKEKGPIPAKSSLECSFR